MTDTIPASRAAALERFLEASPIAQTLGMRCDVLGDEMTGVLPFKDDLIGNFTIQALHGGAIGTFLELTAACQLFLVTETEGLPKPINLTVDYMRQGRAEPLYARAHVKKLGRRMASVTADAWQSKRDNPVASLVAHFLVS